LLSADGQMGAGQGNAAVVLQGVRFADCEAWEEAADKVGDESAVLPKEEREAR
jgi:hypothetical protein